MSVEMMLRRGVYKVKVASETARRHVRGMAG
jgi:hypothetical protein